MPVLRAICSACVNFFQNDFLDQLSQDLPHFHQIFTFIVGILS